MHAYVHCTKIWKQLKNPATEELIKKVVCVCVCVCVCNGILLHLKKDEISPFVTTWIDLEGIMLSDKSVTERQIPYDLTHMWTLRNKTIKEKERETKKPDS